MADEHPAPELNDDQALRLLQVALERADDTTATTAAAAERLADFLAARLPVEPTQRRDLPEPLREISSDLASIAGPPLGELLANDCCPLETLQRVKAYARFLAATDDAAGHEAALVVYHGAIARAQLAHGKTISQHEAAKLQRSFRCLSRTAWVPRALRELFAAAGGDPDEPEKTSR